MVADRSPRQACFRENDGKGRNTSQGTNVREKAMEESASNTYKGAATGENVRHATGLLKQDLEQFECRYRETCCTSLRWLLGMAIVGFGTLTVLLAIGFGWLG